MSSGDPINTEQVLELFKQYAQNIPDSDLDNLAQQAVAEVISTSFDAVEFVLHLEDTLGLEEEELSMDELVPKFEAMTFGQLAEEIVTYMAAR